MVVGGVGGLGVIGAQGERAARDEGHENYGQGGAPPAAQACKAGCQHDVEGGGVGEDVAGVVERDEGRHREDGGERYEGVAHQQPGRFRRSPVSRANRPVCRVSAIMPME